MLSNVIMLDLRTDDVIKVVHHAFAAKNAWKYKK